MTVDAFQTRVRLRRAALLFLMLFVPGSSAYATYRADFFDTSKRPTITFDKGRLTWTLRNQGVERVVHFDTETGGLQTLALRDLHTHHVLLPVPNSEGEISFAAPLLQTPVPLTGWKYTETKPDSAWMQAGFDDKSWLKEGGLPPGGGGTLVYHHRVALPAGLLKAGHAYALYLPHVTVMEVYADGVLAQKFTPSDVWSSRPTQIDLPTNCHVIAINTEGAEPITACTVEVGTAPPSLSLASGWQYMMYTVNAGEDNSRVLTIRLSGLKQYEGFEIDVSYQTYAGEEPTIAKWFSFVSHRKSHFLMEAVTYDRWQFPAADPLTSHSSSLPLYVPVIAASQTSGDMLMTSQLGYAAFAPRSENAKVLVPNALLNIALKPELPQATPKSITAFWHGSESVGRFLYQLYLGQYVAHGSPMAVPIVYNTRYAYGDNISAALCAKIVPLAARLGAQSFMLGDGWQSNITPDTGRYGDWITDKEKFPGGLMPISLLACENHLRFGLWIDATRVNARSQAATAHPDWLYKPLRTGEENEEDANTQMCFTGAWARQFTQSVVSLCREQSISSIEARFMPQENCMATQHEHPTGHSEDAARGFWKTFCDALRGADKTMALTEYGGWNRLLDTQDSIDNQYWPLSQPAAILSGRTRDAEDWRRMQHWLGDTDVWQHPLLEEYPPGANANTDLFALPGFAQGGQALCHLPVRNNLTRDQIDYFWSSVAAFNCNFEIQGNLEDMTADERETGHKWIDWNLQHRDWLAFAQPLTITSSDDGSDKTAKDSRQGGIKGLLHLRNALHGRYGYVCLWNMDSATNTILPSFNPADYFVRMRAADVKITNISDGVDVPFTMRGGVVALGKITLPAYGWAIYEISVK